MRKRSFIDRVKVFIKAGDGGDGHVGFRREKFVPKGGPDGGDGGKGGDIIAMGTKDAFSLMDYQHKRHFRAKNGAHGGRSQKTGASASPIILKVPLGTVFQDAESGEVLGEIVEDGQEITLQKGGKGGLGNQHFATATNQTPRKATPGKKIEGKWIHMELKILADVGLVGFPNAGKSTLLSKITQARPKIGSYAFTTLNPVIGVSRMDDNTLVISDIPGIIEDAHTGAGLGIEFLRHIARSRILLYVINADPHAELDPVAQYHALVQEIHAFDASLTERTFLVVLNKIDLIEEEVLQDIQKDFKKKNLPFLAISCHNNHGVQKLHKTLHEIA